MASSSVSGAPQPGTNVAVGAIICVADTITVAVDVGLDVGVTELVDVIVGDGDTVAVSVNVSVDVAVWVMVMVAVGVAVSSGANVTEVKVAIIASSSSGRKSGRDNINHVIAIVRKSMTAAIKSWYGGRRRRSGTTLGLKLCCNIFCQTIS